MLLLLSLNKYLKGQCCGIDGYWNWNRHLLAPESCCKSRMIFRNENGTESFQCKLFEKGCLSQYEDKFVMACIVLMLVLVVKIILNVSKMLNRD